MKKKITLIFIFAIIATLLQACSSGVSQTDYDALLEEKATLEGKIESLEKEKKNIEDEFAAYKEQMKPFEEMTEAQAEAEKLKAEQEAQKIKEENAAKEAEEKAKKEAEEAAAAAAKAEEEAKGYETGITYDQLARTPDDYEGKKVKFSGKVIQVLEGDGEVHIRLAVNDDYDKVLYGAYESSLLSSRVLEDDEITIYGVSLGLYSYDSVMTTITIPAVWIEKVDQ